MNDLPRHTLSRIIAQHGPEICDTPKRVEALLRDLCGAHRREINIIMGALEERLATDLTAAGNSVPRDVLLARLAARLRDNLAYTPEAARWGVETWAVALGILSETELEERRAKESSAANQSNAPAPLRESRPSAANPASVNSEPQRGSIQAPARQTPPPTPTPPPSPAPPRKRKLPPSIIVVEPPPHDIFPSPLPGRAARRGLTMRSCITLIVLIIILIIAAVFVVPAVITILREEQARPSINEPRTR